MTPLSPKQRLISFGEVLLGAAIVIGHNVFHKIPNEVPILFALFWISFGLRERGWKLPGLRRPDSWTKTILYAVAAVIVLHVGSELVIQPLAHKIWPAPEKISDLIHKSPTLKETLTFFALVWTFAAVGEEFGYRGYLLTRAADLGNRTKLAYVLAMIYVAVLFGFGHWYKGPAGVVDSTYSGLVIGTAYLLSGKNLWTAVLAHGLSDTVAVVAFAMGWAN